ncbi:MAG TPA: ABC transporter ATP-binding protein [Gemmatimonadaceae bacterium]|nr:ABC transporter ATP-binding protein [Gemmatimonadaceae bacterium]
MTAAPPHDSSAADVAVDAPAIELRGLTKQFGETLALDHVDLVVRPGVVFGFLGRNGAGKTTALRILSGLARPTSGTARVIGHDVATARDAVRARIGFLPDVPGFYPWMTAREYLEFAGRLFGLESPVLDARADALLEMAGLAEVTTRVGGYSRGMKQRLGIAQALINAPSLLMLDEPTSALDPIGRREVLEMVASLRGRTTVFFSTHILADVERVCDDVAILERGRVVASAGIGELTARAAANRLIVELEGDGAAAAVARIIAGRAWVRSIETEEGVLRIAVSDLPAAQREIPAAIATAGVALRRFEIGETSLEQVFVEIVGGGAQ